ncbi:ABATE domain-containing protein [Streptomyces violaceusniger]|uniref:CGNR zinc finger domain-containing protein n=1 Tax=Streptomyces violaceusniger TaxID=68280 RepID=UPI000996EA69|nr:CGNR zinc finger domain-containing protein [Streptomyces hygroscopicus]
MDSSTEPVPRPRVTARLRALRFDAGSLALNLVATLGRRTSAPVERLGTLDRLREWCDGVGLRPHDEAVTDELLTELWTLREAAYDVVAAVVYGRSPSAVSVALLNDRARPAPPQPLLIATGTGVGVDGADRPLSGRELQSVVVRDLIAVLGDPERRAALRVCDASLCTMVYLDHTPGGRRRWCSMRLCGNSAKAAKHRERRAAATPAGS